MIYIIYIICTQTIKGQNQSGLPGKDKDNQVNF